MLLTALVLLTSCSPARAGLFSPLLQMLRPRLERTIARECERLGERERQAVQDMIRGGCRSLAKPASACLLEETSRSGRELGVLQELITGRIGDDGEVVVKRCLSRLFGLPANSLEAINLELFRRGRRVQAP